MVNSGCGVKSRRGLGLVRRPRGARLFECAEWPPAPQIHTLDRASQRTPHALKRRIRIKRCDGVAVMERAERLRVADPRDEEETPEIHLIPWIYSVWRHEVDGLGRGYQTPGYHCHINFVGLCWGGFIKCHSYSKALGSIGLQPGNRKRLRGE